MNTEPEWPEDQFRFYRFDDKGRPTYRCGPHCRTPHSMVEFVTVEEKQLLDW